MTQLPGEEPMSPFRAAAAAAVFLSSQPSAAAAPSPATPETSAIIAAAQSTLGGELHKPVELQILALNKSEGWAFVYAHLLDPSRQPLYKDTPFTEAADAGGMSRVYACLLRNESGTWHTIANAVGPTDMAWQRWGHDYSTPASLFQLPD